MDGILLVDKPSGWTSFDMVAKVRNILQKAQKQELLGASHLDAAQASQEERASRRVATVRERQTLADTAMRQEPAGMAGFAGQQGKTVRKIRVGHTGTLDPLATGLLVLLIGDYTKKATELSKLDKTYEVVMRLGQTSATGDEEGEKTEVSEREPVHEEIEDTLKQFIGTIQQTPPAYSAIKVDGQRAYKLARAGKKVILEPRKVTVYKIALGHNIDKKSVQGRTLRTLRKSRYYEYPEVKFTTRVSSGTYIRSLVEDIGKQLQTGAYMYSLRRTRVGEFDIEQALRVEDLTAEHIYDNLKS